MKTTYNVSEAQAKLPQLCRGKQTVTICRRNTPVSVLVPRERWEAIIETLELLANPKAMRTLRDAKAGKLTYKSLEEVFGEGEG
jgi:antitoxin YefM